MNIKRLSLLALGFLFAVQIHADTISVPATQDATLQEVFPTRNFGRYTHVAAGATGVPGNDGPKVTRGLFRFDLTGKIPPGAQVISAKVILNVSFAAGGAPDVVYGLHRVLADWGEGNKVTSNNQGVLATDGEATWNNRKHPSESWQAPGGAPGQDFVDAASSTASVAGAGAYTFAAGPRLIEDVQTWLDDPAKNFGWMLISQQEETSGIAKRFSSRESGLTAPVLEIEYSTVAPFRITSIRKEGENIVINYENGTPLYQLEAATDIVNPTWESVGALTSELTISVPFSGEVRFFRVREKGFN